MSAQRFTDNEQIANLIHAAAVGDKVQLAKLIASGISATSTDKFGRSILHWSAARGQLSVLSLGLRLGVPLAPDNFGCTPLHWAANNGEVAILEYLIAHGAPIDETDRNGNTALHYAAATDQIDAVRVLVRAGFDPSRCNFEGQSSETLASRICKFTIERASSSREGNLR